MSARTALVLTSINAPNRAMAALARGAADAGFDFFVVGDTRSPADFRMDGCQFLDVAAQAATGLRTAAACPTGHYARKNVGYLTAIRAGAAVIVETDDDNHPRPAFFDRRSRRAVAAVASGCGWLNAYRYFTNATIWPRGLPLDAVNAPIEPFAALPSRELDCPIQQGLADEDPDVDAIYRLLLPLPQRFRTDRRLGVGRGAWCPFNSQNTSWWPEAYALMYLPAYCSFRMTDIWRSFVAQRIAWENGWSVLFRAATVRQRRNPHDLLRDFRDEVPGYLANREICAALQELELEPGGPMIASNMRRSYELLTARGWVDPKELLLLDAWLADIASIGIGTEKAVG